MLIHHAIRSMRELCVLRHLSINTEKSYTHWLGRYGLFLKDPQLKNLTAERKIEAFLTRLALSGVSASTQNQAFNALLCFYRDVLKRELGPVDSLRAKRPATIRQCPSQQESNPTALYRFGPLRLPHSSNRPPALWLWPASQRATQPANQRPRPQPRATLLAAR